MGTRGQWSIDFLKALGNNAPTLKTQNLVAAWTVGENTEAKYNPLATTLDYGKNTKFNNCCGGNGVKNYSSRDEGIQATVLTLKGNHPGYADILKGLSTNDPDLAMRGMHIAPWGTNFTHVELVWRSQDVRSQALKSESSNPVQTVDTPNHKPEVIKPIDYNQGGSGVNPVGPDGYSMQAPAYGIIPIETGVTPNNVRKYIYYMIGGIFIITSGFMFVSIASKTDAAKSALSIAKVAAL